jgi:hypothetical protein
LTIFTTEISTANSAVWQRQERRTWNKLYIFIAHREKHLPKNNESLPSPGPVGVDCKYHFMNPDVIKTVLEFVSKAQSVHRAGEIITLIELTELNHKLSNSLPDWFIELYSSFPLSGCQLDFPQYEPDGDFDGYVTIELATPENIYDEMELCYPGIAIKDLGYFCIAVEAASSGDQYFTTSRQGDNPPVFQVFHDVSDEGEEIEKHGMEKVADSLSDFFAKARVTND